MCDVKPNPCIEAQTVHGLPFHRGVRADKVPVITDRYVQCIGFDNGLRKVTVRMYEVVEVSAMRVPGSVQVVRAGQERHPVLKFPGEVRVKVNVGKMNS